MNISPIKTHEIDRLKEVSEYRKEHTQNTQNTHSTSGKFKKKGFYHQKRWDALLIPIEMSSSHLKGLELSKGDGNRNFSKCIKSTCHNIHTHTHAHTSIHPDETLVCFSHSNTFYLETEISVHRIRLLLVII